MGGTIHPQGKSERREKGKEGWKDRGMEEWGHVCAHLSASSYVSGLLFNIFASNKLFFLHIHGVKYLRIFAVRN